MPVRPTAAQLPGLRSDMERVTLRKFLDLLDGHLKPAGPAGGPAWTTAQRAQLWHSIESGWPLGPLTCWAPPGNRRSSLYDCLFSRYVSAMIGKPSISV